MLQTRLLRLIVKIALLSDVHANLPALEEVLREIEAREDLSGVYHLGDLVGYAPWPNEVVAILRERGIPGVAGNYDSTVATDHDHCGCRYEDARQEALAHVSYAWTRAAVTEETKDFLRRLPFRMDIRVAGGHAGGPTVILVHGTPAINTHYWTEDRPDSFCLEMARRAGARTGDILCFGHTHRPWSREIEGILFVNTGSVGRPKDGDARAGYVVLEAGDGNAAVTFVRVEYDLRRAAEGIRAAGLPEEFAAHLLSGG